MKSSKKALCKLIVPQNDANNYHALIRCPLTGIRNQISIEKTLCKLPFALSN